MDSNAIECKECGCEFRIKDYFWTHLSCDVKCPKCGTFWETDWDEGYDGPYGPWLYKKLDFDPGNAQLGVLEEPK